MKTREDRTLVSGNGRAQESFLPRQRPKGEWAHVWVTRDGARYVDVDELLQNEKVKKLVGRLKEELKVEMPSRGKNLGKQG